MPNLVIAHITALAHITAKITNEVSIRKSDLFNLMIAKTKSGMGRIMKWSLMTVLLFRRHCSNLVMTNGRLLS